MNEAERLREFVAEYINREGLRAVDVGSTLRGIAEGRGATSPTRATLRKIDDLLEWEPGSAKRVLDGGDPTPRNSGNLDPAVVALTEIIEETADALQLQAVELRKVVRELRNRSRGPGTSL